MSSSIHWSQLVRIAPSPDPQRDAGDRPTSTRSDPDQLWQRALHQAQRDGFGSWFPAADFESQAAAPASGPRAIAPVHQVSSSRLQPSSSNASESRSASPSSANPSRWRQRDAVDESRRPAERSRTGVSIRSEELASSSAGTATSRVARLSAAFARDFAGLELRMSIAQEPEAFVAAVLLDARSPAWVPATGMRPDAPKADEGVDSTDAAGEVARTPHTSPTESSRTATTGEDDPVRIHAEWSSAGVRVWLGADAAAVDTAPQLAYLVQRWLAGQGERLLSLVCNGRELPLQNNMPASSASASARVDSESVPSLPVQPSPEVPWPQAPSTV